MAARASVVLPGTIILLLKSRQVFRYVEDFSLVTFNIENRKSTSTMRFTLPNFPEIKLLYNFSQHCLLPFCLQKNTLTVICGARFGLTKHKVTTSSAYVLSQAMPKWPNLV